MELTGGQTLDGLRSSVFEVDESLAILLPPPPHTEVGSPTMSIDTIQAAILLLFLGICFLAGSIAVRQKN